MKTIDIHRHQWVHIHRRMHPRKINRMSIIISHPAPYTTMPFHIVINSSSVTIYCPLPFYYRDRIVMHRPQSWMKCYNPPYRPVICFHALYAKHHLSLVYFDSIWIGTIRAIVPFVRCCNVAVDLPIRIRLGITCASNTQCNGLKWRRCDHRVARLVALPILNDQLLIENAFVFIVFAHRQHMANKFTFSFTPFSRLLWTNRRH